MYHLLAYTGSIAATANTDLPAITDDIAFIQNSHYIFQQNLRIFRAAAMSALLTRARITSPSIKQIAPNYIRPIIGSALPGNNPNVDRLFNAPLNLPGLEEIAIEVTNSAAGPSQTTVLLWVGDKIDPIPPGPVYRLRYTSTTTAVANAWTSLAVTMEQQLVAREYIVVGSECISTNMQAHRLIFDNQSWRPGDIGAAVPINRIELSAYDYQLGIMGKFRTTNLPRVQVLCNGADASFEGYLHVIPGAQLIGGLLA